jgi:hypothetical protein
MAVADRHDSAINPWIEPCYDKIMDVHEAIFSLPCLGFKPSEMV